MLGRRRKTGLIDRIRNAVWPRIGWIRTRRFWEHRIGRMRGTEYELAAGFACGAYASFLPFMGLHFIMAAVFAFVIRANVLAALVGTAVGNPWTFPIIWLSSYELGRRLGFGGMGDMAAESLGRRLEEAFSSAMSLDFAGFATTAWPILEPMTVGGLLLGAVAWVVFYWLVRGFIGAYRAQAAARRARRKAVRDEAGPRDGT